MIHALAGFAFVGMAVHLNRSGRGGLGVLAHGKCGFSVQPFTSEPSGKVYPFSEEGFVDAYEEARALSSDDDDSLDHPTIFLCCGRSLFTSSSEECMTLGWVSPNNFYPLDRANREPNKDTLLGLGAESPEKARERYLKRKQSLSPEQAAEQRRISAERIALAREKKRQEREADFLSKTAEQQEELLRAERDRRIANKKKGWEKFWSSLTDEERDEYRRKTSEGGRKLKGRVLNLTEEQREKRSRDTALQWKNLTDEQRSEIARSRRASRTEEKLKEEEEQRRVGHKEWWDSLPREEQLIRIRNWILNMPPEERRRRGFRGLAQR